MEINKTLHLTGQLNPSSTPLNSNVTISQKGDKGDKGDPGDIRAEEFITSTSYNISPNVYYIISSPSTSIILNIREKLSGKTNEYAGEITPTSTTTIIVYDRLTSTPIRWATNGEVTVDYYSSYSKLTLEPGSTYHFSIVNGIGYCVGVELE